MKTDIQIKLDKIIPEELYILFLHANLYSDKVRKPTFVDSIREKIYPVKFTEESYRVIGHWVNCGLLDTDSKDNQWKKFSLLDLIWIKIISHLRTFGYPIRQLEMVKRNVFYSPNNSVWYYLDFSFWQVTYQKKQVDLIVLSDGKVHFGEKDELKFTKRRDNINDYILIDFTKLVTDLVAGKLTIPPDEMPLSDKELELLRLVRAGKYSNIEVIMGNGSIERLNVSENVEMSKRIMELLKEAKYQEIRIQQDNGKIVSVQRTTKIKV